MSVKHDPYDICECGDYRHQHKDGHGESRLNWANFADMEMCQKFRLQRRAEKRAESVQE